MEFLNTITHITVENFNINYKNTFLKLNLTTVNDYRTVKKYFSKGNVGIIRINFPRKTFQF